jgi:ATP-dependent Clp protease ATP-binding subunit ClpA
VFERYTELARRAIFFARYEASHFGSQTIDTHHLLLGLFRDERSNLAARWLKPPDSLERLRKQIESRAPAKEKISTSIDLPLENSCKRILAYANEEAERLNHHYVGPEHLLLGILREERCLAHELLEERGMRVAAIRDEMARWMPDAQSQSSSFFAGHPLNLALAKHNFTVPRQHLMHALAAEAQGVIEDAQRELLVFVETLALAVAPGTSVDDVLVAVRGFRSGLPDEEDWKYRLKLTLLLAELLVARHERHTNT